MRERCLLGLNFLLDTPPISQTLPDAMRSQQWAFAQPPAELRSLRTTKFKPLFLTLSYFTAPAGRHAWGAVGVCAATPGDAVGNDGGGAGGGCMKLVGGLWGWAVGRRKRKCSSKYVHCDVGGLRVGRVEGRKV